MYSYTLNDLYNDMVIGCPSEVTQYLYRRIQRVDYRGVHLSQHNRYTKSDVYTILKNLRNTLVSNNLNVLHIRTTDLKKRPLNTASERYYASMVDDIARSLSRVTQDSLRKNFFVDMVRMGFINRFNNNGITNPFSKSQTKCVNITDFGIQFLNEYENTPQNLFEVNRLWTLAINNLHNGFENSLFSFMLLLQEYGVNSISYDEFAFFVSDLNNEPQEYLCNLIVSFKKLSRFQKLAIIECIKKYANPSDNTIFTNVPKTNVRDYHNWINEAQQLFYLLSDSVSFGVGDFNDNELNLRVGDLGLIDNYENRLRRSQSQKRQYYIKHNIDVNSVKGLGFELHHIVPLFFARNQNEFSVLDTWQNMILIDGHKHAIITQNGSRNILAEFRDFDILFKDFQPNPHIVECLFDINIKYKREY